MAELGTIPKDAAKAIWEGGRKAMEALKADPKGNIEKIDAIERVTKHDVIAFTTWLGEFIGPPSRFVHQGLTSSDVLDTTFAVQLTQAADILLADVDRLLAALKKRALEHKDTLTIGRSHGIHAEPTTFGVKLAGHYAAFARNRARLADAERMIGRNKVHGVPGGRHWDTKSFIHFAAKSVGTSEADSVPDNE
jgi:adenylosuccinate lyase